MGESNFFDESTEQSQVKAEIVAKYFWAWAKVIMPSARRRGGRIAYIDLFAGPGRYKDGTKSTPLLILERAIADEEMRQMLVAIFNDVNSTNSRSLDEAIQNLPGIQTLKYKPQVNEEEIGERVVAMFEEMALIPTLFFVDPWGYKGLSLRLINSVLRNWGCDCIFFFNYNRINMGLSNDFVKEHMEALFGVNATEALRQEMSGFPPEQREFVIVEALSGALQEMGGKFVLPFRFKNDSGARTSHHLIFVSKHHRGYEIMKEIMAKESSSSDQGVPSFEYNPSIYKQGFLFELSRPLDQLGELLLAQYAGKMLTMKQVYDRHNVGTPFIKSNYKAILSTLEQEGKIITDPPAEKRRKATFADGVRVIFPGKQ